MGIKVFVMILFVYDFVVNFPGGMFQLDQSNIFCLCPIQIGDTVHIVGPVWKREEASIIFSW